MIGVITSPTGAVIRDILHRLADRFPRRVLVWPVKVQGEGSAEQVAAAIRGFNALAPNGRIPRPDLLIVARGGGSLEDLWSFNEEIVVRAAAESMIPLISAVGHETDVTLIDFAADVRAPTPTAAAEMAVPVRAELLVRIDGLARRSLACWQRGQEARRTELRAAARALPGADELLARAAPAARSRDRAAAARADREHRRSTGSSSRASPAAIAPQLLAHHVERRRERLDNLQRAARRPRCKTYRDTRLVGIARHRERLDAFGERAQRAIENLLDNRDLRDRARRPAADGVLLSRRAGARLCAGARPRRQSAAPGGGGRGRPGPRHRIRRRPRAARRAEGAPSLAPVPAPRPRRAAPRRRRRRPGQPVLSVHETASNRAYRVVQLFDDCLHHRKRVTFGAANDYFGVLD